MIVKPHAVKEGLVGQILRSVQAGGRYRIVRAATETLDRDAAAEFLAAYRAAVPALRSTVEEMCSGPVVVLEVVLRGTGGGGIIYRPLLLLLRRGGVLPRGGGGTVGRGGGAEAAAGQHPGKVRGRQPQERHPLHRPGGGRQA